MTPALVALAVVIGGGAVVAVAGRTPRLAVLGLLVVLAGGPFVADPQSGGTALAARLVAGILAAYVLWAVVRPAPAAASTGSPLGLAGAAAIAVAAFAAGWLSAETIGALLVPDPGDGPSAGGAGAALAAGSPVAKAGIGAAFALLALGAAPVAAPRDGLRLGIGLLLLVSAAGLLGGATTDARDDAVELALAALIASLGGAIAVLSARMLAAHDDLMLREGARSDTAVRHRPADEAHPMGRR